MNETNLSWDDLRLFLSVARHGGLAGAAIDTRKSAPTLGRRILALERTLGVELFERSARGYALTADGSQLLERVIQLESDVQPILSMADQQKAPKVKVSAGIWVTHYLCQHLTGTHGWPGDDVRFISTNQVLDITHREAVIGIRNAEPEHPNLARQPLQQVSFAVYATAATVSTRAQVVGATPSAQWWRNQPHSESVIEVTDPRNALDLALAGIARAVLPCFIGDAQSTLMRMGTPINALNHQQWLVTHHEDRNRPEVRRVVNWIKAILGNDATLR
ncbi:MAG: LysR family transcriptional regulator [Pseudomonadota bacterium]